MCSFMLAFPLGISFGEMHSLGVQLSREEARGSKVVCGAGQLRCTEGESV